MILHWKDIISNFGANLMISHLIIRVSVVRGGYMMGD